MTEIRHYRAADGIDGYEAGDIVHETTSDRWSRAVADGRGVVLEPCTRHDALVAELLDCYDETIFQGYEYLITEWTPTEHDEASIIAALGLTPTPEEWRAALRDARRFTTDPDA